MQKTKKLSAVLLAMPTTLAGVLVLVCSIAHVLLAPATALAVTSNTVNFQARLMQSSGAIVPDGTYNVEFKLYNALTSSGSSQGSCTGDTNCLWTETRTTTNKITVVNGYLTANLGSVTSLPTTINWDQKLYLSMNIGGTGTASWDGEMSPRLQLTAVPYAFRAGQLATLNGSFTGSLSFVQPTANRSVLIPDESGTICLQSSTACGFALSSGSGSYIQNGTSLQSSANFNISGTGTAATSFQTPLLDTSSAVTLNIGTTNATAINLNKATTVTGNLSQSGGTISLSGNAASSITTSTGALTLTAAGTSNWTVGGTNQSLTITTSGTGTMILGTTGAGTVTVGSSSATINLGITNNAHAVHIADAGTSTNQVVTMGSTNTGSTTTIQGGTSSTAINLTTGTNGSINLTSLGTGKINLTTGSAGVVVKPTTDNTAAFQVQNSSGGYLLNVDTSGTTIGLIYLTVGINGFQSTIDSYYTAGLSIGATTAQTIGIGNTAAAVTIQGTSASVFKGTSGSFTTTLGFTTPTANNTISLPNAGGTICLQSSTSCGFAATSGSANYIQNTTTAQSANMYVQAASSGSVAGVLRANAAGTGDILDLKNGAGTNIATFGSTGAVLLQNSTDSTSAFQIQNAAGTAILNVNTSTGLTTHTGALRLNVGTSTADTFTSPLGFSVQTAINIPLYNPGAAGQILAFGLPSSADSTARAITVFDARSSGVIQPAIALISPNENDIFGLSWNGLNTTASIETASAAIALRPAGTNVKLWAGTTGVAIGANVSSASYPLDVTGDVNTSTQYRIAGTVICTSSGCTPASGSTYYIQNTASVQSANMYVQAASSGSVAGVLRANAAGTGDILDLKNGAGTNVATFSSAGAATFTNSTNSTTAFQVQNAAGGQLLNVDTSSNVVTLNGGSAGALTGWTSTSSLSATTSFGASTVVNGYMYSFGGYGSGYTSTVQYTPLKANGTVGGWSTTTALPAARGYAAAATTTGYVYVLGGTDGSSNQSTIYIAKQNQDGTLGNWVTSSVTLPATLNAMSVTVANGYLYVLGGNNGSASVTNTYYTHINGDGSINSFVGTTALPTALANASVVTANGYIYYLGGYTGSASVSTSYYATLNTSDGTIGSWSTTTALPATMSNFASVVQNGYVYVMRNSATVSYATLSASGAIGTWNTESHSLPVSYNGLSAAAYNGYIYIMGGYTGSVGTNGVYYTSGARTMITGSLDLVGTATTGSLTGDATQNYGSVGGTLTAGNTTIVGTLQVQGQSNFNQNVAINGNSLTVGNNLDSTSTGNTLITVQSRGFAGLELYGDSTNDNTAEGGGAYVLYSTDGILGTEAVTGLIQQAGIDPSGTSYTGTVANNMLIGTRSNFGLQFGTNSTVSMVLTNGGNLCIGITSCTHKLAVNGQIYSTSATITTGTPDIAETIAAADDVEMMDVVMADPDNSERVVKTTTPYSAASLGVVSDGTSGFLIDHLHYGQAEDPSDTTHRVPLTLAGRVYVKVSGTNGSIKPGDYLTSSSMAGYAMKATKAGSTIGKALGYFNGDTGKVLVLVNVSYYDPGTAIQGSTSDFSSLNVSGDATINHLNVATVTVSGDATIAGTLTVNTLTVGSITISGHLMTAGNAPTVQVQASAGQNATVTVMGNDTSGVITILTGDEAIAADLAKLTFATAYNATPRVVITPIGKTSAQAVGYVDQVDPNSFMLGATTVLAGQTYVFSYQVMQ